MKKLMKHTGTIRKSAFAIAVLSTFLMSCSHKLSIRSEHQISTHSKEMRDTLKSLSYFTFPIINVNDKIIGKMRGGWDKYEKWQQDDMHQRFSFVIKDTLIAGVKVAIISPTNIKSENKDVIGFHIHGGGFTVGSPIDRVAMLLSNEYGYTIYSVDYSLSPEVKYPVAINECLSVYKEIVAKNPNKKIISSAISAGGQMLQSVLLRSQSEKIQMPVANVLFSPALDLSTEGDSYYNNDGRDVLAKKNSADKLFRNKYVSENENLKDPLISPAYANYNANFPPTVFVSGTRDLLLSCLLKTFWQLKKAGAETEILISEGGWHAMQYYPAIPEAISARKAVYLFLNKYVAP